MHDGAEIDPDTTGLTREVYAVVRTARKDRKRCPAACVDPVESEEAAIAGRDPEGNLHAARVYGPSPSSEGVRVYYLVRWL